VLGRSAVAAKPPWEYADFAAANKKLSFIAGEDDVGREFERYLLAKGRLGVLES
jgi:hypothetical protein